MSDERSRESDLLQSVRDQNSRLQHLIAMTASLLARSRALLRQIGANEGSANDRGRRSDID
jgi:hypothetical protein